MNIEIYCDGACNNNGGYHPNIPVISSYGFIVVENDKEIYKFVEVLSDRTNNQMELMALIGAYKYIDNNSNIVSCTIYCDSEYAINSRTIKKPKKNKELVQELQDLVSKHPNVQVSWVRGHSDNKWNNIIDKLIVDARTTKIPD